MLPSWSRGRSRAAQVNTSTEVIRPRSDSGKQRNTVEISLSSLARPVTPGPIPLDHIPRLLPPKPKAWLASEDLVQNPPALTRPLDRAWGVAPVLLDYPDKKMKGSWGYVGRRRSREARALRRASRLAYRYPHIKGRRYTAGIILLTVGFTLFVIAATVVFLLQAGLLVIETE